MNTKGCGMDGTNGTTAGWDAALDRMAVDANAAGADAVPLDCAAAEKAAQAERDRTYTTTVRQVAGGREPFAALVALVHHAFEECGREHNFADHFACNPGRECTRAEYDANAVAAYEHAGGAMFEQIKKLRDAAERMAAQARAAADANWRALALELAEVAHNAATTALVVVGHDEPADRPRSMAELATAVARNAARATLAVVERVRGADA